MRSKSVLVQMERPYYKRDLVRLEAVGRKIEKAQKDPEFIKAIKQFIKQTT